MLKDAKKHQKRPEPRVAAKNDDRWKAPRNEQIIEKYVLQRRAYSRNYNKKLTKGRSEHFLKRKRESSRQVYNKIKTDPERCALHLQKRKNKWPKNIADISRK